MRIRKKTWFEIFIYFIIATTLSGVFRFGLFDWYKNMSLPFGLTVFAGTLLQGIGPIAGALILLTVKNKESIFSLFGTQKIKSLIMLTIPLVLFTFFGVDNSYDLEKHYYGFIVGISIVTYGIFEEYGWRGYLLNELIDLKPFQKSLIVGFIWYAWHLSFLYKDTTILNELKFFCILLFSSWGIGAIAEKTKSIAASACFHILGNILFLSTLISTAFSNQTRYIILGGCLVSWIIVVNIWDKPLVKQK